MINAFNYIKIFAIPSPKKMSEYSLNIVSLTQFFKYSKHFCTYSYKFFLIILVINIISEHKVEGIFESSKNILKIYLKLIFKLIITEKLFTSYCTQIIVFRHF